MVEAAMRFGRASLLGRAAALAIIVVLVLGLMSPSGADTVSAATSAVAPHAPSPGHWVPTGSMSQPHGIFALLHDGRVLAAGGNTAAAELYDPSTGIWAPTG